MANILRSPTTFGLNLEEADCVDYLEGSRKGWRNNDQNLVHLQPLEIYRWGLDDLPSLDALYAKDKQPKILASALELGLALSFWAKQGPIGTRF